MTPAQLIALSLHAPVTRRSQWEEPTPEAKRKNRIRRSITVTSWPEKIAAFRSLFCLNQHDLSAPALLADDRKTLHFGLMDEEDRELSEAWGADDVVGVIDAVLDGIYVRLGLLAEMGFQPELIDLAMDEIHASNLTKTDDKGNPVINGITCQLDPAYPAGKVMKGASYVQADLRAVLAKYLLTSSGDVDTVDTCAEEQSNG